MSKPSVRRRLGAGAAALCLAAGVLTAAGPAGATDPTATDPTAAAQPAAAGPSDIDWGQVHSDSRDEYSAYAIFYAGSGYIQSDQECHSGDEYFGIYGPWEPKDTYSQTNYCVSQAGSNYYATKK